MVHMSYGRKSRCIEYCMLFIELPSFNTNFVVAIICSGFTYRDTIGFAT